MNQESGESEVLLLFQEVAARFPCASIARDEPQGAPGPQVTLRCGEAQTAAISVIWNDDWIDCAVGHTSFEILTGKHRDRALRHLAGIVDAVVNGRIEERIWRIGGETARSKAVFILPDGKRVVVTRAFLLGLLLRLGGTVIHWAPWTPKSS